MAAQEHLQTRGHSIRREETQTIQQFGHHLVDGARVLGNRGGFLHGAGASGPCVPSARVVGLALDQQFITRRPDFQDVTGFSGRQALHLHETALQSEKN